MAPPNKATPKPGAAKRPTQQQLDHEAIAKLTKDNERLKKIYRANFLLGQFQDLVLARAESWRMAALNIGSAYALAAKNHTDAMAKQDKIDALRTQLIFSVLTVASSGTLSWVTSGLQLAETFPERKVLVDALPKRRPSRHGRDFQRHGAGRRAGHLYAEEPVREHRPPGLPERSRESRQRGQEEDIRALRQDQEGICRHSHREVGRLHRGEAACRPQRLAEASGHPGRRRRLAVDRRHGRRAGTGHLEKVDARAARPSLCRDPLQRQQCGRLQERGQLRSSSGSTSWASSRWRTWRSTGTRGRRWRTRS